MKKAIIIPMICVITGTAVLFSGCGKKDKVQVTTGTDMTEENKKEENPAEDARDLLKRKYSVTDEMLEGIDAEALVEDYRMDENEYTKEEVWEIIEEQREYYAIDPSKEIFSILGNVDEIPEESSSFSEDKDITKVAYYRNPGSFQEKIVFDLENNVYYKDDAKAYKMGNGVAKNIQETLKEAGISKWSHVYKDRGNINTTGSFGWKLAIEQEGGNICYYGGYTKDMSVLPENFVMVEDILLGTVGYSIPERTVLSEKLGCNETTAASIRKSMREITGKTLLEYKYEIIMDDGIRFLKAEADDGTKYFAQISEGYFIASVHEGAIDGKQIYTAYR